MEKLQNLSTRDLIVTRLREQILSGAIPDGAELLQSRLAEQLETSRIPVRDALQRLALEGLVEQLDNRHVRVLGLRRDQIDRNLRAVAALEREVVDDLAGARADASALDHVLERHRRAAETPGGDAGRLEVRFHLALSALCANRYLRQVHQRLFAGYPQYALERLRLDHAARHGALADIADALRAGSPAQAAEAVSTGYRGLAEAYIEQISWRSEDA